MPTPRIFAYCSLIDTEDEKKNKNAKTAFQ